MSDYFNNRHETYKKVVKVLSDKDIRKERFQRFFVIGIISLVGALVIWLISKILIGIPHDFFNQIATVLLGAGIVLIAYGLVNRFAEPHKIFNRRKRQE